MRKRVLLAVLYVLAIMGWPMSLHLYWENTRLKLVADDYVVSAARSLARKNLGSGNVFLYTLSENQRVSSTLPVLTYTNQTAYAQRFVDVYNAKVLELIEHKASTNTVKLP